MIKIWIAYLAFLFLTPVFSIASDHDDGEADLKGRALNITDLYVFREDSQDANAANGDQNLILIMNTNPRSLPGQEYFFSTDAWYQFHITQNARGQKTVAPTGREDIVLRFQFEAPTGDLGSRTQNIRMSFIKGGRRVVANVGRTTSVNASKAGNVTNNDFSIDGSPMTVFAGLRQDPFYFDVEAFFKLRALAGNPAEALAQILPPERAKDFTHNYNINSIVARVPLSLLQDNPDQSILDVWTTIMVPRQ